MGWAHKPIGLQMKVVGGLWNGLYNWGDKMVVRVTDPGKMCIFIGMVIRECVGKARGSCKSSKKGDM